MQPVVLRLEEEPGIELDPALRPDIQLHLVNAQMRDHARVKADRDGFTVTLLNGLPDGTFVAPVALATGAGFKRPSGLQQDSHGSTFGQAESTPTQAGIPGAANPDCVTMPDSASVVPTAPVVSTDTF